MKTYFSLCLYCALLISTRTEISQFYFKYLAPEEKSPRMDLPDIGTKLLSYPRHQMREWTQISLSWKRAQAGMSSSAALELASMEDLSSPRACLQQQINP